MYILIFRQLLLYLGSCYYFNMLYKLNKIKLSHLLTLTIYNYRTVSCVIPPQNQLVMRKAHLNLLWHLTT